MPLSNNEFIPAWTWSLPGLPERRQQHEGIRLRGHIRHLYSICTNEVSQNPITIFAGVYFGILQQGLGELLAILDALCMKSVPSENEISHHHWSDSKATYAPWLRCGSAVWRRCPAETPDRTPVSATQMCTTRQMLSSHSFYFFIFIFFFPLSIISPIL